MDFTKWLSTFFTVSENRYPNEPLMECVSDPTLNPGTFNPACAQVILKSDWTDVQNVAACQTQTGCIYRSGKIPNSGNLMNEQN